MRIALTGSGTATSTGFFKAIRSYFDESIELIGLDTNPVNSCEPFVNLSLRVPKSDDDDYAEYLADLCSKLGIDLLMPILDIEFITLKDKKSLFGSKIFMPDYCWRLTDKEECDTVLTQAACMSPMIRRAWRGNRLIWKPRYGAGGAGIQIVGSKEEMDRVTGDGLFFDYIDGREYTVDFFALSGNVVCAAQRLRKMTRGGVCTIAEVDTVAKDANTQLERIVASLNYDGPGCFQFIRGRKNDIFWTDLNPRVGGGTALTVAAGLNIPAIFVSHLIEAPPPEMYLVPGTVVRFFEEHAL